MSILILPPLQDDGQKVPCDVGNSPVLSLGPAPFEPKYHEYTEADTAATLAELAQFISPGYQLNMNGQSRRGEREEAVKSPLMAYCPKCGELADFSDALMPEYAEYQCPECFMDFHVSELEPLTAMPQQVQLAQAQHVGPVPCDVDESPVLQCPTQEDLFQHLQNWVIAQDKVNKTTSPEEIAKITVDLEKTQAAHAQQFASEPKVYESTAEDIAAVLSALKPHLSANSVAVASDGQSVRGSRKLSPVEGDTPEETADYVRVRAAREAGCTRVCGNQPNLPVCTKCFVNAHAGRYDRKFHGYDNWQEVFVGMSQVHGWIKPSGIN